MRKTLIVLIALAAAALLECRPSQAYDEGAWCAVFSFGRGGAVERCHFRDFESCRMEATGGNRGFCRQNARWPGYSATHAAKPKKARKRARR